MNYAGIKEVDIEDGDGVRVGIYVSGCHFHCKECHNKEAWDFNYGKKFTETEIDYILQEMNHDYISGLSILGGEPLELVNQQGLIPLVKEVKAKFPDKTIWLYTGYQFDKDVLFDMYKKYDFTKELIDMIDIVVDGQFEIDKKIIDLKQRGSYNQRKIDVQASIVANEVITMKFGDENRYEAIEKKKENPKVIWITEFPKKDEVALIPTYTSVSNVVNNEHQEKSNEFVVQKEKVKIAAKGIV